MLAIIDCLKKFEPHLTGIKFDILTNHAPLTHWQTQREMSPRQIRWNETLTRFDANIQHIPGISNAAADALSRYPYVQPNERGGGDPANPSSYVPVSCLPCRIRPRCSSFGVHVLPKGRPLLCGHQESRKISAFPVERWASLLRKSTLYPS
jgi:RNase H-like domain found in reverse transcriptase